MQYQLGCCVAAAQAQAPFYYTIHIPSTTIIIASHQSECHHQNICIPLEIYVTHPMNINHSLPHAYVSLVSEYPDTTFLFFVFMLPFYTTLRENHFENNTKKNTN